MRGKPLLVSDIVSAKAIEIHSRLPAGDLYQRRCRYNFFGDRRGQRYAEETGTQIQGGRQRRARQDNVEEAAAQKNANGLRRRGRAGTHIRPIPLPSLVPNSRPIHHPRRACSPCMVTASGGRAISYQHPLRHRRIRSYHARPRQTAFGSLREGKM
jgi:hypothetical protein